MFGIQIVLRIELEPSLDDVMPLVVVQDGDTSGYGAFYARPTSPGIWDFGVHYGDGYPLDSTLSVYLIRR
jgi:hypothetical protein